MKPSLSVVVVDDVALVPPPAQAREPGAARQVDQHVVQGLTVKLSNIVFVLNSVLYRIEGVKTIYYFSVFRGHVPSSLTPFRRQSLHETKKETIKKIF